MMVMLDNNVLIDALASRQPFDTDAQSILRASAQGKCSCCFTANSATDIYYVLQRTRGADVARDTISDLLQLLPVVSVTGPDCKQALGLPIDDFEDALNAVCAEKVQADCIVTRDGDFLKADYPVRTVSPADFLLEIE